MADYDSDGGVPAPEPTAVVAETAKGSDKALSKSKFRITSLDLGQTWRAGAVGSGLWAAARACKEVGSTSDENFSEAEDALMVMLLAGADPCRRNARGQLPIHFAESASATRILVDLGGLETLDAVDVNGLTPLHCAARGGHTARAKELVRLGADTLRRDARKNTPADTVKLCRKQELYEVLKWAARRQANGAAIPAGGLLGESETDRKAKLLRDDAEFARWKRATPCAPREGTFDRAKNLPAHMQRGWWSGPLPEGVHDARKVDKRLQRHCSTWSTALVQLWISTEPSLGGFAGNAHDMNRRVGACKVTGRHLAYLHPLVTQSDDPMMQFLGMLCFAPKEKREIVAAFGRVLALQMGMAPAPFLDRIDASARVADLLRKARVGDAMLQREAQRLYEYNAVELPVALGDRSGFVIIGSIEVTPLTSLWTVWERLTSGDTRTARMISKAAKDVVKAGRAAEDLLARPGGETKEKEEEKKKKKQKQGGWFWLCTPRDNRRMCRVSIDHGKHDTAGHGAGTVNADAETKKRQQQQQQQQLQKKKENKGRRGGEGAGGADDGRNSGLSEAALVKRQQKQKQEHDEAQYLSLHTPCYPHAYPLLLIAPCVVEVRDGVEWTGTRMLRQWIEPGEIAAKDAAWKTAHRFKIEGYEAKKRWAEAERVREIQRANELGRKK
jgi:hypothetical protein